MAQFRLISYSVSHICLVCYLLAFTTWRFSAKKTAGIAAAAVASLFFFEWVRYVYLDNIWCQAWTMLCQIVVVQVTAVYLSRYRDARSLFTGLTSSNYVLFGTLISRSMYDYGWGMAVSIAAGAVIHLCLLTALVIYLRSAYLELQIVKHREWLWLCLIPMTIYLALRCLRKSMEGPDLGQLLATLFLLLAIYLTYILVFQVTQKVNREHWSSQEMKILETSIRAQKRAAEEIYRAERQIAIQNHDQRHLFRTMKSLMAEHDYEAVNQMLNQVQEKQEAIVQAHYCDNTPVNGIVSYYVSMAVQMAVQTHIALDIPEQLTVNEWELSVVIGNLMENAVQAAGAVKDAAHRELWMNAKRIRGQILIEILNTFEGGIVFDKATALPMSDKGEGHGLGVQSVAYFAEHNKGTLDCGTENGRFFVRLLF